MDVCSLFTQEHLGYFKVLVGINKVTISMCADFCGHKFSTHLGKCAIAGLHVKAMFSAIRNWWAVFQSGWTILQSHEQVAFVQTVDSVY